MDIILNRILTLNRHMIVYLLFPNTIARVKERQSPLFWKHSSVDHDEMKCDVHSSAKIGNPPIGHIVATN